jgi:sugar (pentulose or hexulose) kinase
MSFIAIDLGTSFIKGAVLNPQTFTIEHVHRVPFPDPLPGLPALHREFDPHAVLAATRSLLAELSPLAGVCEGIVMCSQMHGLVFTTERGELASNLTTWQDQRVLEPHPSGQGTYFDVMAKRISAEQIRQLGNELRPGQPLGVLFWLAERGQLPGPDLFLASLPDFVLANLCGTELALSVAEGPTTETTNAMAHGALNLETLDWHWEVLGNLGLDRLRWPRIRRHGEVVGHLKIDGKAIPCYTPVGDYQCALTGALLQPGELSLNISTGSQVSMLTPCLEFGDFQTRPFFDGRFLKGVTHIPAGRALNALVKLLTELAEAQVEDSRQGRVALADPWPYIARAAAAAGPTALRVNLAFFTSSCGDRGEIANIREEELTVGHLFRAAFQNMTDNYYACALRLCNPVTWGSPEKSWRSPSTPLTCACGPGAGRAGLVFSGGLAQKIELLRALICEKFDVPHRMCPTTEDTMLGLLALALAFTGRAGSVQEAMADLLEIYREESLF